VRLYDQLLAVAPGPIAALNRAVAVAEVEGVDAALAIVEALRSAEMERYYLFHAIHADLLERAGRREEAAAACDTAIERTANAREREFLKHSLVRLRTAE
jgi:RNA polymerase sigma-70 factor (ECF subfamily)